MYFFKENPLCRDSVDLPRKTNRASTIRPCHIWTAIFVHIFIDIWIRNDDTVAYAASKKYIVFLTLLVALYFCKAINVEIKWKGKPSLLRVFLVLFKVGEKMQNKRMLTKIYHLSAILYTAPTSNGNWLSSALYWFIVAWNVLLKRKIRKKRGQLVSGAFTTSWRQKKKTERWSRCLFVHPSIPLEFSLQSRTRRGEG